MTTAKELVGREYEGQQAMWGADRTDNVKGEMREAAICQIMIVQGKATRGFTDEQAVADLSDCYPEGWGGFRSYGSDVANLVVAAAFLHSEIDRLIASGADTTRTKRGEPYQEPNIPIRAFPDAAETLPVAV